MLFYGEKVLECHLRKKLTANDQSDKRFMFNINSLYKIADPKGFSAPAL